MVLILAFVSTFLSAALDCTPDLILSESAIPVGWGKVPHKCTPYPRRSPRFPTSHDLNLMRAYESNILGPSPIGFLQQRRTTVFFWRVPDVWCEDRELSFAAFFLTWVSTLQKWCRSFISDNTFLCGWV